MIRRKHGFTVIEIVLVLALAGAILGMVFFVLPSISASQRDAARKANVMSFITAVKNFQTNNSRGALPNIISSTVDTFSWTTAKNSSATANSWQAFVKDYVTDADFNDPSGTEYTFYIAKCKSGSNGELSPGEACAYQDNKMGKVNNPGDPEQKGGVDHTIYVAVGAVCDGDHAVKSNSVRNVAAVYILERAGRYCAST